MRAFVAVDVPAPELDGRPGGPLAPTHLTLLFLGDILDEQLPPLVASYRAVAAPRAPFEARLARVGAFPSPERPRVVWVGVDRGAPELTALHDELARSSMVLGLEVDERPFVPHLTLFRVRGRRDVDRAADLLARHSGTVFGSCQVGELLLKSSVLTEHGAVHSVRARLPLEGVGSEPREPGGVRCEESEPGGS